MTPKCCVLYSLLVFTTGCSTQTIHDPPLSLPASFSVVGQTTAATQWWDNFDDEQLNALINIALDDNFNLKAASDRLRQADALARKAGATARPSASLLFDGERTFQTSGDVNNFQLGLKASYEIDLWSRLGAGQKSAEFNALATRKEMETAAISLSSEVARNWFEVITWQSLGQQYQLQIRNLQSQLKILELRYRFGQIRADDLMQQKQLIENLNARLLDAQSQKQLRLQQLALLTGQTSLPDMTIPEFSTLPPIPATGIPSRQLGQRPDVKQAWYKVEGQQQNLIVAEADRLPQIQLTASLLSGEESVSGLLDDWVSSLAASLTATVFDGGNLKAEVERQQAALDESVNLYSQTVLEAFAEVETALVREAAERQQLDSVMSQLTLARQTEAIKNLGYRNGDSTFLEVLTAQNSRLDLEQAFIKSQGQLRAERILLHRALAGGLVSNAVAETGVTSNIISENTGNKAVSGKQ